MRYEFLDKTIKFDRKGKLSPQKLLVWYFLVILFIMLHKAARIFETVVEILKYDRSN